MKRRTPDEKPGRPHAGPIGIVGLGLIGGSLAKSLHARFPKTKLIGIEPSARTRALARASGIFDTILPRPSAELRRCGMVFLCAPVPAIRRLLGPVSGLLRDGAILTDVGGVKEPIVVAARADVRRGVSFVGAHPMFGGEGGGFATSSGQAWEGGTVAICTDGAGKAALGAVARLHRSLGARVVFCTAAQHDAAAAAVSHLPYVVASALALTARDAGPPARILASKGFADATRPAAFAYRIQGEAARANERLPGALLAFCRNLARLLDALNRPGASPTFERARRVRESLPTSSK